MRIIGLRKHRKGQTMNSIKQFEKATTDIKVFVDDLIKESRLKLQQAEELENDYKQALEDADLKKSKEIRANIDDLKKDSELMHEMALTSRKGEAEAKQLANQVLEDSKANITELIKSYEESIPGIEKAIDALLKEVEKSYKITNDIATEYKNILKTREYTTDQEIPTFELKKPMSVLAAQYNAIVNKYRTMQQQDITAIEMDLKNKGCMMPNEKAIQMLGNINFIAYHTTLGNK